MVVETTVGMALQVLLAASKLGVFLLFLIFTVMSEKASRENDLRWWAVTAAALTVLAAGELMYVLAQIDPEMMILPGLGDFTTIRTLSATMYAVSGVSAALYLRTFLRKM